MGILANPQWELYARELVELELACTDENMQARRGELRHQAYKKAGYSGNADNARRLANNRKIKLRFRELFAEALEYRDVRAAQVVVRIDRVGRANLADFLEPKLDANGKRIPGQFQIKNLTDLPRELTEALAAVEFDDAGQPKIKLWDKNQANFTLLKHLGGLPDESPKGGNLNLLALFDVDDQRIIVEALKAIASGDDGNAGKALAHGTSEAD